MEEGRMTLKQAAAKHHYADATLRQAIRERGLPAVKVGNTWTILEADLLAYIQAWPGKGRRRGHAGEEPTP